MPRWAGSRVSSCRVARSVMPRGVEHRSPFTRSTTRVSQSVMPPGAEHGEKPAYTEYHPRWYRPRMSTWWWLKRRSYLVFILRELSSIFVAWTVAYLLLLVHAVSQGPNPYKGFRD